MASSEMIFNADILSRISVSIPLYATGPALLVPWPGTENRLLVPLRVFDPLVYNSQCSSKYVINMYCSKLGLARNFCCIGTDDFHFSSATHNLQQVD